MSRADSFFGAELARSSPPSLAASGTWAGTITPPPLRLATVPPPERQRIAA